MSEAELLFTALSELSTRQIAEVEQAQGVDENAQAGKQGGKLPKMLVKHLKTKQENLL